LAVYETINISFPNHSDEETEDTLTKDFEVFNGDYYTSFYSDKPFITFSNDKVTINPAHNQYAGTYKAQFCVKDDNSVEGDGEKSTCV